MEITTRPCYVCGTANNPIIAVEKPIERRGGRPLLPEGVYAFARCGNCGALYVDSDVDDAYLAAIYAEESVESVRADRGVEHGTILNRRLPEFEKHWQDIIAARPAHPGDKLLDLGCQSGDFGAVAARDGVIPSGIELSHAYSEACRRRWGRDSVVHCGPIEEAPFQPGQFQYITAFETLEHMCAPIDALVHLRTWLADDGILALSVPSSDYFHLKFWLLRRSPLTPLAKRWFTRRAAFYNRQVLPHTHIYNFSHRAVRRILERAGFVPIQQGLTGWHGRIGSVAAPATRALEVATRSRVALSPSVFALARAQN